MKTVRWGILGTGGIARKFAEALSLLPDAQIAAVGSRTKAAAEEFGDAWKIPRRYGSYLELANDPETDVIYIATIHTLHRENCLDCLKAGKAVLCEKPFTINAAQAAEVIALARQKKLFLMEAMWTRYFPVFGKVRELLAQHALGDIRLVQVDFAFRPPYDPKGRLYNPELGGGALMDIGVYPVSLASMVFGEPPRRILSSAAIGRTGVDEQGTVILEYTGGRQASIAFSFQVNSPQEANIVGTEGRIRIERPWWNPHSLTVARANRDDEKLSLPYLGNGYTHEAMEVMDCLRSGRTESERMPLEETLRIMQTLDAIRSDWGIKYPGD
jgi:dihydrodiol dehydrogenase / D-xylose 1-dehydrogenase (NADP)